MEPLSSLQAEGFFFLRHCNSFYYDITPGLLRLPLTITLLSTEDTENANMAHIW